MTMVEQYREDGYLVLHNAVRLPWWLRGDVVEDVLSGSYIMSPDEFRAEARLIGKEVCVLNLFLAQNLQDTIRHLGIARPIMQTSPVIHAMGFDQSFDGTKAHQDWAALQSGLNTVVVWIPLHDVGVDNYPLEMVPGSHKLGLLPAKAGEHYSEVETEGMGFVPVSVPAGGALLFSVFTVHRTRTPGVRTRVAFSHRYEDSADPWAVEHDHYSAQKRIIEREIKTAPSVEQVRAVFS